jgi:hypothetical protein
MTPLVGKGKEKKGGLTDEMKGKSGGNSTLGIQLPQMCLPNLNFNRTYLANDDDVREDPSEKQCNWGFDTGKFKLLIYVTTHHDTTPSCPRRKFEAITGLKMGCRGE